MATSPVRFQPDHLFSLLAWYRQLAPSLRGCSQKAHKHTEHALAGVTQHMLYVCAKKNVHIMNINVSAGVGAPPLDTQLLNKEVQIRSVGLAKLRYTKERVHVALLYSYRYLKVKVEVQQLELGIIGKLMKWCKQ